MMGLGLVHAMILPPYYYRDVSEDGIGDALAAVIDGVGSDRLRVCAYNIPQGKLVPVEDESFNHGARTCRVGKDGMLYITLGQPFNVPPPELVSTKVRAGTLNGPPTGPLPANPLVGENDRLGGGVTL